MQRVEDYLILDVNRVDSPVPYSKGELLHVACMIICSNPTGEIMVVDRSTVVQLQYSTLGVDMLAERIDIVGLQMQIFKFSPVLDAGLGHVQEALVGADRVWKGKS